MSLFFAYTKAKPTPEWWPGTGTTTATTVCEKCGETIRAGVWPFCPHDKPKPREEP